MAVDNGNGRVRDARLEERLSNLTARVDEMSQHVKYNSGHQAQVGNEQLARIVKIETVLEKIVDTVDKLADMMAEQEKYRAASAARWEAHEKEHSRQARTQVGINGAISAALMAVSTWLGTR